MPCRSQEEAKVESLSLKRREGPRRSRGWVGFSSDPQLLIQFFLWHPEPICRTFCVSSHRLPSVLCKHGPTPVSGGGAGPEPGQWRCHCLSRWPAVPPGLWSHRDPELKGRGATALSKLVLSFHPDFLPLKDDRDNSKMGRN